MLFIKIHSSHQPLTSVILPKEFLTLNKAQAVMCKKRGYCLVLGVVNCLYCVFTSESAATRTYLCYLTKCVGFVYRE